MKLISNKLYNNDEEFDIQAFMFTSHDFEMHIKLKFLV